ncbi:MAG: hypothetical protein ACKPDM_00460 [Dolichospermum sp.]
MENQTIEMGFSFFKEKYTSFLNSLNIFLIFVIFLFFAVFLPYITFTGNTTDWLIRQQSGQPKSEVITGKEKCKFDTYNLDKKWLVDHLYPNTTNKKSVDDRIDLILKSIYNRIQEINIPLIGNIPITNGEFTLLFPFIISIGFGLLSIQLQELTNLRRYLMKLDKDNEFGMRIYTHISTIRILFSFGTIISFYLLSNKMLLLPKYQIAKIAKVCSLMEIIKERMIFQQNINVYTKLYIVSFLIIIVAVIILINSLFARFLNKPHEKIRRRE